MPRCAGGWLGSAFLSAKRIGGPLARLWSSAFIFRPFAVSAFCACRLLLL